MESLMKNDSSVIERTKEKFLYAINKNKTSFLLLIQKINLGTKNLGKKNNYFENIKVINKIVTLPIQKSHGRYYIHCEHGIPYHVIFSKDGKIQESHKKKYFLEAGNTLLKIFENHVQLYNILSCEKKSNAVLVAEANFIENYEKHINVEKILQNLKPVV
jgi:hypothetical protein